MSEEKPDWWLDKQRGKPGWNEAVEAAVERARIIRETRSWLKDNYDQEEV